MKQIVDKLNKIAKKIDENVEIPQTDLIIDSLDAITKAYGGTPNDSNLIVDKLEDIYNNISSAPSGNIEITENTAEGEPLDISQYATATVNVPSSGMDFVIPEQTISTSADSTVEIQTTFDDSALPDRIVLQIIATPYGQPFHELLVLNRAPQLIATGYTIETYGELAGTRMKLNINIYKIGEDSEWYITIFVNDTQTAFTNVLLSAIGEWPTTPQ